MFLCENLIGEISILRYTLFVRRVTVASFISLVRETFRTLLVYCYIVFKSVRLCIHLLSVCDCWPMNDYLVIGF